MYRSVRRKTLFSVTLLTLILLTMISMSQRAEASESNPQISESSQQSISWVCNTTINLVAKPNVYTSDSYTPPDWRMTGPWGTNRHHRCKTYIRTTWVRDHHEVLMKEFGENLSQAAFNDICANGAKVFVVYGHDGRNKTWNFSEAFKPNCTSEYPDCLIYKSCGDAGTVWADDHTTTTQGTVTTPIRVKDLAVGLGGVIVDVRYDPAVVKAINCQIKGTGVSGVCNPDYRNNTVRFALVSSNGINRNMTIGEITFDAVGASGVSPLDIRTSNVYDVNADSITLRDEDGSIKLIALGDVNCDAKRNIADALLIQQYDSREIRAASSCPLPEGTLLLSACDVNDDGLCNIIDSMFIMQCAAGVTGNALCPTQSRSAKSNPTVTNTPTEIMLDIEKTSDVLAVATLKFDIPSDAKFGAGTLDIIHDESVRPIGCTLDESMPNVVCNYDYHNEDGQPSVRITAMSIPPKSGELTLATIEYEYVGTTQDVTLIELDVETFVDQMGSTIPINAENQSLVWPSESIPTAVTFINKDASRTENVVWLVPLFVIGLGVSLFTWSKR